MLNRRQTDRGKTYLSASIIFNSNGSIIDRLVRNLSARGAMIELESFSHPPDEFYFEIARGQRAHRARIAWRGLRTAGLLFTNAAASARESVRIEWARRLNLSCQKEACS